MNDIHLKNTELEDYPDNQYDVMCTPFPVKVTHSTNRLREVTCDDCLVTLLNIIQVMRRKRDAPNAKSRREMKAWLVSRKINSNEPKDCTGGHKYITYYVPNSWIGTNKTTCTRCGKNFQVIQYTWDEIQEMKRNGTLLVDREVDNGP